MDPNFAFPRPQAPIPRPPPPSSFLTAGGSERNRDSNALRASVLDVALQLGLGTNSTVADWMFNNTMPEDEEEVYLHLSFYFIVKDTTVLLAVFLEQASCRGLSHAP